VAFRGEVHRGEHQPILDAALLEAVQGKIAAQAAALPAAALTRAADRPHL
jgi:hypothetical protein